MTSTALVAPGFPPPPARRVPKLFVPFEPVHSASTARVLPRRVRVRRMRRQRRARGVVWLAGVLIVTALWAAFLRPTGFGGESGYVMVRGVSMLPTYQSGDLVITRPQTTYRVGDIVAFQIPDSDVGSGVIVIHRIIGGSARTGYVLRGDNNAERDAWRPKPEDIVGEAWVRVPRLAHVLEFLRAPVPLAALATGMAVAFVLVPKQKTRGQRSGRYAG